MREGNDEVDDAWWCAHMIACVCVCDKTRREAVCLEN